jgi:hypothetical protein
VLDVAGLGVVDGLAPGGAELEASGEVGRADGSSADEAPLPMSGRRSIAATVNRTIAAAAMRMTVRVRAPAQVSGLTFIPSLDPPTGV